MLMLSRKFGEQIMVGDDICITIGQMSYNHIVRIGIDAPKEVVILRKELYDKDKRKKDASTKNDE